MRLFLAVDLPSHVRTVVGSFQQDLKRRLERSWNRNVRVGWVEPQLMHLTLKFLGETDEQITEPLRNSIEELMVGYRRARIPLARVGAFPRAQQPRILWIGPETSWEQGADAGNLTSLHHAIDNCCERYGFGKEARPFSPHLTLARVKEGDREVGQALARSGVLDQPVSLGFLPVDAIVLMKSELRPKGPLYSKLWEVRLPSGSSSAAD
jgi:2'-5' RNA ligase